MTKKNAGSLSVIGLGPGGDSQRTEEASEALERAQVLFGYAPYLERVPSREGQQRCASDNRQELDRARAALEQALAGKHVGIVSGGDPGVFGMAAAVCEAIESGPGEWRSVPVTTFPGVTAMLALAARVGAPLGHDFCAISLSDNLKPWEAIESRLRAVVSAGFVIAIYNPISRHRPWQLGRAAEILKEYLPTTTPVAIGRAVGRIEETVRIVELEGFKPEEADMSTCIIVGSPVTRIITRGELLPLVYTPRSMPTLKTSST
jgi:precorrin-3B C17-methyltransferase